MTRVDLEAIRKRTDAADAPSFDRYDTKPPEVRALVADVRALLAEVDALRVIVEAVATEYPPIDSTWGDCQWCNVTGAHAPTCTWLAARAYLAEQMAGADLHRIVTEKGSAPGWAETVAEHAPACLTRQPLPPGKVGAVCTCGALEDGR